MARNSQSYGQNKTWRAEGNLTEAGTQIIRQQKYGDVRNLIHRLGCPK